MIRSCLAIAAITLGLAACANRPLVQSGNTQGTDLHGFVFSQALGFEVDGLEVCARFENRSDVRWVLRSPLRFGGNGQLRALMGPPLTAPLPPQGKSPAQDDLLSYDLLEPRETRAVCTLFARTDLPDGTFRLETLFQPWTRQSDGLPLDLAFAPGAALLNTPPEGALSGACLVTPADDQIDCDRPSPE